jgi:hypothetical protein
MVNLAKSYVFRFNNQIRFKTIMIPDLQSSLICDDVRQERNGKFILIGLFDAVAVRQIPVRFQHIFVVNRWCSGEGTFKQITRILMPDQHSVMVKSKEVTFTLTTAEAITTNVEVFINLEFKQTGTYWIEVLLDNDLKIRYPLKVSLIKKNSDKK